MNNDSRLSDKENAIAGSDREPADTPNENRFADPAGDADPRTSDEGVTSVGATDLNADTATINQDSPDAVPGVRRG